MPQRFALWGWTEKYGVTSPVRITVGSLRDCRVRQRQFRSDYPDALDGIYEQGDEPTGLAVQVQERIPE